MPVVVASASGAVKNGGKWQVTRLTCGLDGLGYEECIAGKSKEGKVCWLWVGGDRFLPLCALPLRLFFGLVVFDKDEMIVSYLIVIQSTLVIRTSYENLVIRT